MSTISASTTSTTAYKVTADTTGALVLQTGSGPTTAVTVGTDQSVAFAGAVSTAGNQTVTGSLSVTGSVSAPNTFGFKNRIINGAMMIDQRNAGASVTPSSSAYTLDRWKFITSPGSKFSFQQSSTVPTGFQNSVICTSLSAYSAAAGDVFRFTQFIEGYNVADLGFGTASAATITISFWVRSSLTGTFPVSLINENADRSYVTTYTISAANTWEQKSVTIVGDTTGTWPKTTGAGLGLVFDLGSGSSSNTTANAWQAGNFSRTSGATSVVGTNGATFYITGVQLEKGSTATSFDYRPYGTELQLCQRYYEKSFEIGTAPSNGGASSLSTTAGAYAGYVTNSGLGSGSFYFKVQKRTTPTFTPYGNSSGYWFAGSWGANASIGTVSDSGFVSNQQQTAGFTQTYGHWTASAEL